MSAMLARGAALVDPLYISSFINRPVACFHGTSDFINDYNGTALFVNLLQNSDTKLYSYDGYYHNLLHEPWEKSEKVINECLDWLDERT